MTGDEGGEAMTREEPEPGIRTLMMLSYDFPITFYGLTEIGGSIMKRSAAYHLNELGCMVWYGEGYSGHEGRKVMDVDGMVERWHKLVVGMALAHDKDAADRYEASVEECLQPLLAAPVRQLREFGPKLLERLRNDKAVPWLIWRPYEVWMEQIKDAPDEDVKELKTQLAKEIVDMVEDDAKAQLPDAMVRALQWRPPEKLEKVKEVVAAEKAAGRSVRLKGRESCLFLEAGGTEDEPAVCVQV